MNNKFFVKTFGCQMNTADSEKIAAYYLAKGYQEAEKIEEADLVVINTCSVRESAENRVFGLLHNLGKRNPKPHIVLTGCMVGSTRGEKPRFSIRTLREKTGAVDEYKTIPELVKDQVLKPTKQAAQAPVKIMEGCNNFCSYCVVPYARGREQSRDFEEIVCEIENLAQDGVREVVLLGQNVNSYGRDLKPPKKFSDLLKSIHGIERITKISFLTSNPWDLSGAIIEVMALPKIDRYFHLAVQSGDDEVLRRMNRKYTAEQFMVLVEKLRKTIPDIRIGTDIIVGFPGETEEQFQNTVRFCQKIGLEKAYISKYSPRPGTAAFRLVDDVSAIEKKRRWEILNELINKNETSGK